MNIEHSGRSKSELYVDLLPLLNSRAVDLLDDKRLITQLMSLERRTSRSGKDAVDHPPGGRDDLINAAAGAIVNAPRQSYWHGRSTGPRVLLGYEAAKRAQWRNQDRTMPGERLVFRERT